MKRDKQRLSELSKFARGASFSERKDNDAGRFMNNSLQIYWKDKSGISHRFWIHPRGTKFNEPCPGIYIYARETSPTILANLVEVGAYSTMGLLASSPGSRLKT